jgi:hypothetical protein
MKDSQWGEEKDSKSMKDSQWRTANGEKENTKGQTIIYKTLHRKLRMEQHEPH